MKIDIEPYDPNWGNQYQQIQSRLNHLLHKQVIQLEHIGSTAVPTLAAKPIIDIAIGVQAYQELDTVVPILTAHGYIYIAAYNEVMPNRRFFIQLKDQEIDSHFQSIYHDTATIPHEALHANKWANIHVWIRDSEEWVRHIAFREYLKQHVSVCEEYTALKQSLMTQNWADGHAYNRAKNDFIQREEKKAVAWYQTK